MIERRGKLPGYKEPEPQPPTRTKPVWQRSAPEIKEHIAERYVRPKVEAEQERRKPVTREELIARGLRTEVAAKVLPSPYAPTPEFYAEHQKFRSDISTYPSGTKFEITKEGVRPVVPTTTSLITKKYESKPVWEQIGAFGFSPIVQGGRFFTSLIGKGAEIVTGGVATWMPKEFKPGEWHDPDTGKTYVKETLILGYRPVTTYYDPFTGTRFTKKDDKLIKMDSGLLEFTEITHKLPTGFGGVVHHVGTGLGFDMGAESKEAASWYKKEMQKKPWMLPVSILGEIGAAWAIGKGIGTVASPIVRSPTVQAPFRKMGGFIKTGGVKIGTQLKSAGQFTPKIGKNIYSKLFKPYTPGGSTWLAGVRPSGGVISTFVARSPLKYGLKATKFRTYYLTGKSPTDASFIQYIKGDKHLKMLAIDKTTGYKHRIIDWKAVTEGRPIVEHFKWYQHPFIDMTPTMVGQKIIPETVWHHMSASNIAKLTQIYGGKGSGYIAVSIGEKGFPYGFALRKSAFEFGKWKGVFSQKGLYSTLTEKTIRFEAGLDKGIKLKGVLPTITSSTYTPSTYKGMTFMQKFFPKGYTLDDLRLLEFLESGYKTVVSPTKPPGVIFKPAPPMPVVTPLLKDIGLFGISKFPSFASDFAPKISFKPEVKGRIPIKDTTPKTIVGKKTIPSRITTRFPIVSTTNILKPISVPTSVSMVKSGQVQQQRMKQAQIPMVTTRQVTQPVFPRTPIPKYPFLFPPQLALGGRGRRFLDEELFGKKYKFRMFKLESPLKGIKL